jgi:hypothetical protein
MVRKEAHERGAHALEREIHVAFREIGVGQLNVRAVRKIRGRICARFKGRTKFTITLR